MTSEWQDSADQDQGVVRVEGIPKGNEEGKITRRELLDFKAICRLLGGKLKESGQLGEEYLRAKVAQETNAARRTAEEAAEIASRREENEASADAKRQEATSQFIDNLKSMSELPASQQVLALAKLLEQNPDIEQQLDRIESIVQRLQMTRGLLVENADLLLEANPGGKSTEQDA